LISYATELAFARQLALDAGTLAKKYFDTGPSKKWKSDGTPLTEADIKINKLVIDRVKETYPEDNVLGEEASDMHGGQRTWVCDPIDGTLPFSHGLPISTFTISLVIGGNPVVAVIYDPYLEQLWHAVEGGGAYMNDEPIKVNNGGISNSYINLDFLNRNGHAGLSSPGEIVNRFQAQNCMVSTLWSSVLAAAMVASGQATAAICASPHPHDAVAGKLIVEEAGGKVTSLYGDEQQYDGTVRGFIASNGLVHDDLLEMLKK